MHWWVENLSSEFSYPFEAFAPPLSASHVYTDASRTGFGAVTDSPDRLFAGVWTASDDTLPHINTLEFGVVVAALETWPELLRARHVTVLHVDNTSAIAWTRRLRTPAGLPFDLALRLAALLLHTGGQLDVRYINTHANTRADLASRDVCAALQALPSHVRHPPPLWLPSFSLPPRPWKL